MKHDKLCPFRPSLREYCECDLISKARADERGKMLSTERWDTGPYHESVKALGYEQGQRDERERIRTGVTGLPICTCSLDHDPEKDWCALSRVLDVIDREASA